MDAFRGGERVASRFDKEFNFYLSHQVDFVAEHEGEYVVIKGEEILGFYGSELEAIRKTLKEHELGTFLVQRISEGDTDYKLTFRSRVAVS